MNSAPVNEFVQPLENALSSDMSFGKKIAIGFAITISVIVGVLAFLSHPVWYPGLTPKETARILIADRKFGVRALERAKNYHDDDIVIELQKASDDFRKLNSRNGAWVAEVLSSRSSDLSLKISRELYGRSDDLQAMVGAVGLMTNGGIADLFSPDSRVLQVLAKGWKQGTSDLAILVLGESHDVRAVTYLSPLLSERAPYDGKQRVCSALGKINDPASVQALEAALRDESFEPVGDAFQALLSLKSPTAVRLGIARVTDEQNNSSLLLIRLLEQETRQNFGADRQAWTEWTANHSTK